MEMQQSTFLAAEQRDLKRPGARGALWFLWWDSEKLASFSLCMHMLEVGITGQRLHQRLGQVRATFIDSCTKVLSSGHGNHTDKNKLGFLQTACTF